MTVCDDVSRSLRLGSSISSGERRVLRCASMSHVSNCFFANVVAFENCAVHKVNTDCLLCCALRHSCCTTGENLHTTKSKRLRRSLNPWSSLRRAFRGAFFATERQTNLTREISGEKHMVRTAKKRRGRQTMHLLCIELLGRRGSGRVVCRGRTERVSISIDQKCVSIQECASLISG